MSDHEERPAGEESIGPYQIVERIGAGGMGEVFKALDKRLDRWVAIKRIRADKGEAEDNRERFRREARAVAKLNHPAIVHVYDIFQDGESDCIVMEYVEGQTLDTLIAERPLDPLPAAAIGHEIADGLAEAHEKGLIHRDLKTENIIVTPSVHAKILDFGLAKPLVKGDFDSALTAKGQLVGTSRAMSPEYVSGEEIDSRSDIFSLGVLLYEAVTGQSPFKTQNTLATLKQVILRQQTPAHVVNPEVPEDLSNLIEALLQKEPDNRPQTAAEVAQELGRIASQISGKIQLPGLGARNYSSGSVERIHMTTTAVAPRLRRYWIAWLAVSLAAVLGGTFFWLNLRGQGPKPVATLEVPEERLVIVLGNFENFTEESLLDDSLDLAFRVGLEQSRFANVLPQSQMRAALTRMQLDPSTRVDLALGREISQRENAKALVIGSIVNIGGAYSLSAKIIDPQTGESTFSYSENASDRNAILPALENVTKAIRGNLGESLAAITQTTQPLEKVTTRNLEALQAYSLGESKILGRQEDAAITLFQRAISLDPEFAMAHAKLGTLYSNRDQSWDEAEKHLHIALRYADRLTEFERLYVEGWVAFRSGTQAEMIRVWTLVSTLYPTEFIGHHNLGMAYWRSNQFANAAQAFETAARLGEEWRRSVAYRSLGYCHFAMANYEEAEQSFERSRELDNNFLALSLAELYVAVERYPDARAIIEEYLRAPSSRAQTAAKNRQALYHADQGQFQEALRVLRSAEELARDEGLRNPAQQSRMQEIAYLERLDPVELRRVLVESSDELMRQKRYEDDPSTLTTLALLGKMSARNGDVDKALEVYSAIRPTAESINSSIGQGYVKMLKGEILAAQGKLQEATHELRNARNTFESFQAHESLARALERSGDRAGAITEFEWVAANRGWALAECVDNCFDRAWSVLDTTLALLHVARLYEEAGEMDKALVNTEKFLKRWRNGDRLAEWEEASERFERLKTKVTSP